jgi:hypothetical protein
LGCAPRQRHPGDLLERRTRVLRVDPSRRPSIPVRVASASRGADARGLTVNIPLPPCDG